VKLVRTVFFLIFAIATCQAAMAEKRVALVVGNSGYAHVPALPNPRNDAADMAVKLKGLGFTVISGTDLGFLEMRRTIRSFINSLDGSDIALFFYAGHGLQVNGKNYMIPIDAQIENENDLDFEAISIALTLAAMERSAKTSLIFLDACRNNPLARNLARSMGTRSAAIGRGLARIGTGIGTLISYSTQPGNVALDGEGRNSPFTAALLEHLGTPGEGVTRDMIRVRNAVLKATDGKQVPWDNSSLTGEVILVPTAKLQDDTANNIPKENTAPRINAPQGNQVEIAYWESIKDASDKAYYEAYLKKYPDGQFADLAQLKLAAIDKEAGQSKRSVDPSPPNPLNSDIFNRQKLAMVDPNAAGSALPKASDTPQLPQDIENGLGLKTEDYQRVQIALNTLGFDVGAEDGAFGPKSRAGLRKYQLRNQLEISGYLTRQTLAALTRAIEDMPRNYDGKWSLVFHRWNYASVDRSGVNRRSVLARAIISVSNGKMFVVDGSVYSSSKPLFKTFKGHISDRGRLTMSMTIDSLFDNEPTPRQEVNVTVRENLPTLVPYSRMLTYRGSRLWLNKRKGENVWLKLEMVRVQ
jgi:uncharacterized caspase-like protein